MRSNAAKFSQTGGSVMVYPPTQTTANLKLFHSAHISRSRRHRLGNIAFERNSGLSGRQGLDNG
jgi:hypothetical protein